MSTQRRQIILDTETTGREINDGNRDGNRIIEIGCLEMINRRLTNKHYHQYINPQRLSEAGALAVHGLKNEFLCEQPLFKDIIEDFLAFIKDSELIIHNAPFDIAFLNHELQLAGKQYGDMSRYCTVLDTLPLARQLHPGQRNSLDALCKRYSVDNSHRELHGALLDAELLARVYLGMTGGQTSMFEENNPVTATTTVKTFKAIVVDHAAMRVVTATETELAAHEQRLEAIAKASGQCIW